MEAICTTNQLKSDKTVSMSHSSAAITFRSQLILRKPSVLRRKSQLKVSEILQMLF